MKFTNGTRSAVLILVLVAVSISLVALLTVKVAPALIQPFVDKCNRAHPCATTTPTITPVPSPSPTQPPAASRVWAAMPGWQGVDFADMRSKGVAVVVVELTWKQVQPTEGGLDTSYLQAKRDEIALRRSQGFGVILNYGLHHAPAWLLNKANARFVNQFGEVYAGEEPNLIFATEYRSLAESYTATVFSQLGTNFVAVRTGGGHFGELQYPDDAGRNLYWDYDGAAARTRPTGAWIPGQSSPNGEASRFLTWHLDSLAAFAKWQVTSVRAAGYSGPIGVLLASDGMRYAGEVGAFGSTSDFDQAVAVNLNGTSPAERNGEVQPGYDHRRMLEALATLPNKAMIAPWATYAESTGRGGPMTYIAGHGTRLGLYPLMAENSGNDSPTQMDYAVRTFKTLGGSVFAWVRGDTLYTPVAGVATMTDYARLIAEP